MSRIARILVIIGIPLAVAIATHLTLRHLFSTPIDPIDTTTQLFEIGPQQSFQRVAAELQAQGYIQSTWPIGLLARLKGQDTAIKVGEYELSKSMSPEAILDRLASGKVFVRKVTIKEGASIWEVGKSLEEAGISRRIDFEPSLTNPTLLQEAKIPASSFEGYLFPDTYQFPKNTAAKVVIKACISRLDEIWHSDFEVRLGLLKLTKHQILTLASIIEKESGSVDEQPTISSVFHNRLSAGMKLQADPTVIYGIPNFNGNLTKDDLQNPSPYNTYVIEGLPPGPIGNPGLSSIKAALYPQPTDFLYFVADGTGKHRFAANLDEHNRNVDAFQRNGGREKRGP